jgi:hypothetical protein
VFVGDKLKDLGELFERNKLSITYCGKGGCRSRIEERMSEFLGSHCGGIGGGHLWMERI